MRIALLALVIAVAAGCSPAAAASNDVVVDIRYSRFTTGTLVVPAGVPVTFRIANHDPIAHEWIVGTPDVHATHRTGTEPVHEGRANEVSVAPYETRVTTVTFARAGELAFICHLPGHEEYGMAGTLRVVGR